MPESQTDPCPRQRFYVATAPKSNCRLTNAIFDAMEAVKQQPATIPAASAGQAITAVQQKLGHGIGYEYAHDFPKHFVASAVSAGWTDGPEILCAIGKRLRENDPAVS